LFYLSQGILKNLSFCYTGNFSFNIDPWMTIVKGTKCILLIISCQHNQTWEASLLLNAYY